MQDTEALRANFKNVRQAQILWMVMETKLVETALAEESVIILLACAIASLVSSEPHANIRPILCKLYHWYWCHVNFKI